MKTDFKCEQGLNVKRQTGRSREASKLKMPELRPKFVKYLATNTKLTQGRIQGKF